MSRYYYGDEIVHEYKGFQYCPEDDIEPEENCKRMHNVYVSGSYFCSIPLSPYSHATYTLFKNWIDMGMPSREQIGGHHNSNHEKYYAKWLDDQIDKELLSD